jgi:pyridinium-3,5-biscarboxylic acid mononucleotide synthase
MTPEFKVDFERGARIGLDEALFCEGKTVDQISAIVDAVKARSGRLLLTRLDGKKHQALVARHGAELEFDPLSRTAILGEPHRALLAAPVAIVMAGTSDMPVGREAARTLAFAGQSYREYIDVGVAGLWRVLERIEDIRSSPVVIVAAGMDAALVSVVGGLVSGAVIALPTSVGYGAALGGATALCAALASCAPGISVVNIDNGYGAACAALRISLALAVAQKQAERGE